MTIFFGRGLEKDKKKVVKEVSAGLCSSASLTSGEADGQEELSEFHELCGQEEPCPPAPYTALPPLRAHLHGQMPPSCQGHEEQLLKDCEVTKQPIALSHLSAPDGTGAKAGFRSTTISSTTSGTMPTSCSCSSWITLIQHSWSCVCHTWTGWRTTRRSEFALLLFALLKIWTVETHF